MHNAADVLVLGGGVAGLAAAGELGRRGISVALIEARERLGGRILTVRPRGWNSPVELGAEFVHAGNTELWRRLRRHRIGTEAVPPRHWWFHDGALVPIEDVDENIARVTEAIEPKRMRHWSFADFLRACGSQFDVEDRELAAGFVEGFQAAAPERMSASAIAEETLEDDEQCRLPRGYGQLVRALIRELGDRVAVHRAMPVSRVEWRRGVVRVHARGEMFPGRAAIVTLPLGVLQAKSAARGAVRFEPSLRAKQRIAAGMGVGQVIRIVLRFDARRWRKLLPDALRDHARTGFGFIHSRLPHVPVWWSLSGSPVITGWSGGPSATKLAARPPKEIVARALIDLSKVLRGPGRTLRNGILGWETHNWSRDPFSRGAYSFIAAGRDDAAEKLRQPIQDTLFFAGEATADGEEVGTVHGALASGVRAAEEVRRAL